MELTPDVFPAISHLKGPIIVSFVLTSILFGCSVLSFISYLQFGYTSDRRAMRTLSMAVAAIGTLEMAYSLLFTMRTFAVQFGRKPNTDDAKWESVSYTIGGVAHVLVAGFFATRAYRLYGRPVYLAVLLGLLLTLTAVAAIGATVAHVIAPMGTRSELDVTFNYILFISQMVGDVLISALIINKLLRSRTGWKNTDAVLTKLVILAIECQAPPALMAIAFLITFVVAPYRTYILAFTCFPQVSVLGYILTINARYTISARVKSSAKWDISTPRPSQSPGVHVTTEVYSSDAAANIKEKTSISEQGTLARVDSMGSIHQGHGNLEILHSSESRLV